MSLVPITLCAAPTMSSTPRGLDLAAAALPRITAERLLVSSKDGPVEHAPDPVTLIDGDLAWINTTGVDQDIELSLALPPRQLVTSNPNQVLLTDTVTHTVGVNPSAPEPVPVSGGYGTGVRLKTSRSTAANPEFGRIYLDQGLTTTRRPLGRVRPGYAVHVRYRCSLLTPGEWRVPAQPRHEAHAHWARLQLWAFPVA